MGVKDFKSCSPLVALDIPSKHEYHLESQLFTKNYIRNVYSLYDCMLSVDTNDLAKFIMIVSIWMALIAFNSHSLCSTFVLKFVCIALNKRK